MDPNTATMAQDALLRARASLGNANDVIVMAAFAERGIPLDQIEPRQNCLTFWAWKALGRSVKRGEHGVGVTTWIPITKRNAETGEPESDGVRPRTAYVFHISQTQANGGAPA